MLKVLVAPSMYASDVRFTLTRIRKYDERQGRSGFGHSGRWQGCAEAIQTLSDTAA